MDSNLSILIGAIAYIIFTYLIIQLAVKSALSRQADHLQMITRILISRMKKDGYTDEELTNLRHDYDEKFWERLKGK